MYALVGAASAYEPPIPEAIVYAAKQRVDALYQQGYAAYHAGQIPASAIRDLASGQETATRSLRLYHQHRQDPDTREKVARIIVKMPAAMEQVLRDAGVTPNPR